MVGGEEGEYESKEWLEEIKTILGKERLAVMKANIKKGNGWRR